MVGISSGRLPREGWGMASKVGKISDAQLGWGKLALGGVEVHSVPGNHLTMLEGDYASVLAKVITRCLRKLYAEEENKGHGE